MKQYFAKYLPVEEELKLKDLKFGLKVSTPSAYGRGYIANHNHTEDSVMVIYNMEEEGYYKLSELKLLKLCLCSRDIQVGDKITYKDKEYEVTADSLESVKSSKNTFKIIGEISNPEITEGQEFTEEEIQSVIGINFYKH